LPGLDGYKYSAPNGAGGKIPNPAEKLKNRSISKIFTLQNFKYILKNDRATALIKLVLPPPDA
jgi:hypothetical protein